MAIANNYAFGAASTNANLAIGGMTAISSPHTNKIVLGQPGCEIEVAGNLVLSGNKCAMCKAATPLGVLLSGAATRVLFCFSCAKEHLHGSVKELVDALDVKDKVGETA